MYSFSLWTRSLYQAYCSGGVLTPVELMERDISNGLHVLVCYIFKEWLSLF